MLVLVQTCGQHVFNQGVYRENLGLMEYAGEGTGE